MTTKQLFNELLADLAGITEQAHDLETAKMMGKQTYLFIEYASAYGGYRLVSVGIDNGAHYGAFGGNGCEGRLNAKMMELKLRSLIAGASFVYNFRSNCIQR